MSHFVGTSGNRQKGAHDPSTDGELPYAEGEIPPTYVIGSIDKDGNPVSVERDDLTTVGTVDHFTGTLIVDRDDFGNWFINGQPANLTIGPNRDIIQEAIQNGPEGAATGGGGGLTAAQSATIAQNQANFAEDVRQFDINQERLTTDAAAGDAFAQQQLDQQQSQFDVTTGLSVEQFNIGNQIDVEQANATLQQTADLANQQAALTVAVANADLRAREASHLESIREFDIQDARDRESMRFLLRQQQVATEENNRSALLAAQTHIETVNQNIRNSEFRRTALQTEVATANAEIENNVNQFNAQEKARVEQLNETRRQFNLEQLQSVSRDIGTLSQNPADVGKLAAFLRAGNPAPISEAIARGENAITDESLLGLRGLLGVREGLLQGPTVATPNLIGAPQVGTPEFGELGTAPEVGDVFSEIGFDPSGIERGESPGATDPSAFFQGIGLPPEIEAQILAAPPELQAQMLAEFQASGGTPTAGGVPAGGGASLPFGVPESQLPGAPTSPATPTPPANETLSQEQQDAILRANAARQSGVLPEDSVVRAVGASVSDEDIAKFFEGFAGGGKAPPGTPVVVGDGKGDSRELAMIDAQGNLVVIPFDKLPHAADGGSFGFGDFENQQLQAARDRFLAGDVVVGPNGTDIGPTTVTKEQQLQRATAQDGQLGSGPISSLPGFGGGQLDVQTTQPAPTPIASSLTRTAGTGGLAGVNTEAQPLQSGAIQPSSPTVQQTAQNPLQTQFGPVDSAVARTFQTQVGQDALRRGGFDDPSQVSPLKVSAPGTSKFLQTLSASAAGALGFGSPELFFEELMKLQATGVRAGVARRTA